MAGRLRGRVAIITGAARGQGRAAAERFVAEGARVLLTDVLADAGAATAVELGDAAAFVGHDVRDESGWAEVVEHCAAVFGPPTILVNNAGIMPVGSIVDADIDDLRAAFEVNVVGPALGIRAVTPSMEAEGGGSIVNVSSIAGLQGVGVMAAYSTSKFALRGLSRSASVALGHRGIRVNSVHPGPIDTDMIAAFRDPSTLARRPIPRYGTATEVADVVTFLASDESSFMTGAEVVVDGGAMAGA
jgi:3alpha(or 20beta)-hydroxysteroid dehydrogenase